MSAPALQLNGIGKRYRIGDPKPGYQTLREMLVGSLGAPLRRTRAVLRRSSSNEDDLFWALRDLSFDVSEGEVVGVVGCNGAGKSTLLKILSRITEPTTGEAIVRGRVGSLLEVGTGFHPELTGRENIFLNGSILGMKRAEIARGFDAIVDFAEIERFLDTPVKHYSSGMYVRLAFSVAAHLEPEILLVDEVLAVGDVKFQNKCLKRMDRFANAGRTVVFVSHAMSAVRSLCSRGIVLDAGRMLFDGSVDEAIRHYVSAQRAGTLVQDLAVSARNRPGSGEIRTVAFWAEDDSGRPTPTILNGHPATLVMAFKCREPESAISDVAATIVVKDALGSPVFYHHNLLTRQAFDEVKGSGEFRLTIPRLPLRQQSYRADLHITTDGGRTLLDIAEDMVSFDVVDGDFFGTGADYSGGASVMVEGSWELRLGSSAGHKE